MDELEKKLKLLKSIIPDAGFASISKRAILSTTRSPIPTPSIRKLLQNIVLSLSVTTAAILVVVIASSIKSSNSIGSAVAGLQTLESEIVGLESDINIALKEISSFGEAGEKTALALSEAAGNGPAHLNASVLNMELNNIQKVEFKARNEINSLLEKAAL